MQWIKRFSCFLLCTGDYEITVEKTTSEDSGSRGGEGGGVNDDLGATVNNLATIVKGAVF